MLRSDLITRAVISLFLGGGVAQPCGFERDSLGAIQHRRGKRKPECKRADYLEEIFISSILPNPRVLEVYNNAANEFRANVRKNIEKQAGD